MEYKIGGSQLKVNILVVKKQRGKKKKKKKRTHFTGGEFSASLENIMAYIVFYPCYKQDRESSDRLHYRAVFLFGY